MKGFLNPYYPMSNRDSRFDQTWGGAHPRLRAGAWYPKSLLPRVLRKRDRFVGTTSTDYEIGKVDIAEAIKRTGSPAGFMFDPPEFRFFKGAWEKRFSKINDAAKSPDPHPLNHLLNVRSPGDGLKKYIAKAAEGTVNPVKTEVDQTTFSRAVKQYAYDFGAEAVGITKINRDFVYYKDWKDPLPKEYTHAILVAFRHPYWRIRQSPAYTSDVGSWVAYHFTAFITIEIADLIRELGYPAKANSMLTGYDIILPPHEIEAGFGEHCRIGINLHPVLGPAYKVGAVLTALPLLTDRPIAFNLESFCEKCGKCARECPADALPKGKGKKVKTRGVFKWQANAFACFSYWRLGNRYKFPFAHDACARCIYVCPWTKHNAEKWQHRMVVAMVSNFKWLQRPAIIGDDIAGYGKQVKADPRWEKWF